MMEKKQQRGSESCCTERMNEMNKKIILLNNVLSINSPSPLAKGLRYTHSSYTLGYSEDVNSFSKSYNYIKGKKQNNFK